MQNRDKVHLWFVFLIPHLGSLKEGTFGIAAAARKDSEEDIHPNVVELKRSNRGSAGPACHLASASAD